MKKLLVTAAALLAILLPVTGGTYPGLSGEAPHDREAAQQSLMNFVCTVTTLDCSDLALPHIQYTQLDWAGYGVAGVYFPGTDVIFLDVDYRRQLDPIQFMSVMVHEMAHYVRYNKIGYDYDPRGCNTEAFAWHVGNSFLVWMGLAEEADYEWYQRYGCEAPGPVASNLEVWQ